jgi:3-hydroxyacyl-[acyl-carrier-protein] dehydratase
MPTAELRLAADHPAARGHFPGNPVIPGATLLAETLLAIAPSLGASTARCRIRNAKFLAPARPGDRVDIEFNATALGAAFACRVDGVVVMKGEVLWNPRS